MNKFLELLEQHCQWIAIGIGGLFLAWMLYAGVLVNPAAVESTRKPGEQITPGDIDREIKKDFADPLQRQIDDTRAVQTPPSAGGIVREPWEREFAAIDRPVPALFRFAFNSQPGEFTDPGEIVITDNKQQITALPEPAPPVRMLDLKSARANVANPPAPGAPAGGPAVAVNGKDITYVRGHFSIDMVKIAQAFRDTKIPQQATTSILAIEIYREQLQPDGTWSKPERIKLIDNGVRLMPLPPNNANKTQIQQFRGWAESPQGQTDLLRPVFYTVAAGEGPWDPPVKLQILDPEKERQKKLDAAREARIEAEKAARAARAAQPRPEPTPEPAPRPRRGSRNTPESPLVNDPERPGTYAELAGLELAQATVAPDQMFNPGDLDPNAAPGANPVAAGGLPQPSFNPMLPGMPNEIVAWFFDENVQEGRKYRYNARYAIRNPAFESNLVAKPALAQQFAIWSELDENGWSEPVEIEPSTHYFLAQGNWAGNNVPLAVSVEVFKWAGGKWQRDTFRLSPGDRVGTDTNVAKFRTDNILVDIRYDERLDKAYVLFLSANGRLAERNPIADRNDPLRQALMSEINPAAPGAPGAVGGGPIPPPVAGR